MANKIILIHGLGGTKDGTWGKFPELLEQDDDITYEVHSVGYTTPMPEVTKPKTYYKLFARAPTILNIANAVLTDIETICDIEKDDIILAGHSLGGIILKKVMLILNNKGRANNINKVCFFDVPHEGSGYASIGKFFAFRNRHLKALVNNSDDLNDLNDQWIGSQLHEKLLIQSIVAENDDIVSSTSSKSIFRNHDIKTISSTNHKTIVKPENSDSRAYVVFKNFILKKNTVIRYKCSISRDFKDWKSLEERNHAFNYASDTKRQEDLKILSSSLGEKQVITRLVGASGMGKTRILLEAIKNNEQITDEHILVFDASDNDSKVRESVRKIIEDEAHGLVIVENCNVDLHNHLSREIRKKECPLNIVTIGYINEQVDYSNFIQLSPMTDEAIIALLTPILIGLNSNEIRRIAQFAQGYPLMATLIAEQYQKEGKLLGSIAQRSVVRKLISTDGRIQDDEKDILTACSLFDVFGTTEGTAGQEAEYIAVHVANSNLQKFDKVLRTFTAKQIINRAGRYARVVPKPLALTLASDWWEEASHERQHQLVESLPESLFQSFCTQAVYLDNQPNIKKFSDKLFGQNSPFTKAEVLLTERGSKLFRTFVEINPESTCSALYFVLDACKHSELLAIEGNIRRNLIWGIEKLCFHSSLFDRSAWCMLLLASAENETWGNNATGMFTHLYKVYLSGTQADPNTRLELLKKAINHKDVRFEKIVIQALKQALKVDGVTRISGAEYQGTKPPLQDWTPSFWHEIFDYWKQVVAILDELLERERCEETIRKVIGESLWLFSLHDQTDTINSVVKKIVEKNGPYWPEALANIKNALRNDEKLTEQSRNALNAWSELLDSNNADFGDKIKMIVSSPPHEHQKDEDGHYKDIAEENARAFATSISNDIDIIYPYLSSLLQGDQRQTYYFAYQLALEVRNPQNLLKNTLLTITTIEDPNVDFLLGFLTGIEKRCVELWNEGIETIANTKELINLYPSCIKTGKVNVYHLSKLLELVENNLLPISSVNLLSYGSATRHLNNSEIVEFCMKLSTISEQSKWISLNIIFMHTFFERELMKEIREPIKQIVTGVPLYEMKENTSMDAHHWKDMVEKLLETYDEDFAISLSEQIIYGCNFEYEHGNIWHNIKPILAILMAQYGTLIWPKFSEAIISSTSLESYWLGQILSRDSGLVSNAPSVLSELPTELLIEWCHQHNPDGAIFISRCLNIFVQDENSLKPSPLFVSVVEHFGSNEHVTNELYCNYGSRGWSGSLVPYLKREKEALSHLCEHSNPSISRWVESFIRDIDSRIDEESLKDDERSFGVYRYS